MMKKQSLWTTDQFRYCTTTSEIDTFHISYCSNELLEEEKYKIFEMLFNHIAIWEVLDELKEIRYQVLTSDPEHAP